MNHILFSRFYFLDSPRAQAALSLVFLIGGIIILIGVTMSFVVVSFVGVSYGFQSANRAIAVASAGANDAFIKLVRDKGFSSISPYTVPVGSDTASVTVNQNAPVAGQAKIVATATIGVHQRKIQAVVSVNESTGQVHLVSWEQLSL